MWPEGEKQPSRTCRGGPDPLKESSQGQRAGQGPAQNSASLRSVLRAAPTPSTHCLSASPPGDQLSEKMAPSSSKIKAPFPSGLLGIPETPQCTPGAERTSQRPSTPNPEGFPRTRPQQSPCLAQAKQPAPAALGLRASKVKAGGAGGGGRKCRGPLGAHEETGSMVLTLEPDAWVPLWSNWVTFPRCRRPKRHSTAGTWLLVLPGKAAGLAAVEPATAWRAGRCQGSGWTSPCWGSLHLGLSFLLPPLHLQDMVGDEMTSRTLQVSARPGRPELVTPGSDPSDSFDGGPCSLRAGEEGPYWAPGVLNAEAAWPPPWVQPSYH